MGTDAPRRGDLAKIVGVGLVVVGGIPAASMLLLGGWPSLVPFLLLGLGLAVLAVGWWAGRDPAAGTAPGLLRRRGEAIALAVVGALVLSWVLFGNVTRLETYRMAWSFDRDEKTGAPDRRRILLEFVDHPGWVSKVNSGDLGAHLESLGSDTVDVVFEVTRDYGRVRGFHEIRIAGLDRWDDRGGGFSRRKTARVKGEIGPSPFE